MFHRHPASGPDHDLSLDGPTEAPIGGDISLCPASYLPPWVHRHGHLWCLLCPLSGIVMSCSVIPSCRVASPLRQGHHMLYPGGHSRLYGVIRESKPYGVVHIGSSPVLPPRRSDRQQCALTYRYFYTYKTEDNQ